ncbi:MAG: SufD family Fe-S cluster assembly protein [Candidatus Aenigmatarchaeota archaeon]
MSTDDLYKAAGIENAISNPNIAHLVLDGNEVKGSNMIPGLNVETEEMKEGVSVKVNVENGSVIEKPVHMCFGMSNREGIQKIDMEINIGDNSKINILSHCIFPDATDVKHLMNAIVNVGKNAEYTYLEKHIHSHEGEIEVVPEAEVFLDEGAKFKTDFELLKGRVGKIDIKYKTIGGKDSVTKMTAKIDGKKDDMIDIEEICHLNGEGSRGVLETRVAARDETKANVYNEMIANAAKARGHVDCKEIVKDEGKAEAVPVVKVNHPKAHVTHEAAIGSVDKKQLETLMARGLSEDEGTDLIIKGLLNG